MVPKLRSVTAAIAISVAGTAVAAPPSAVVVIAPDVLTREVAYTDINLASVSGERMLKSRVGDAVGKLCLEATGAFDGTYDWSNIVDCRDGAWRAARPQIAGAVQRARQMAASGSSAVTSAAIVITASR